MKNYNQYYSGSVSDHFNGQRFFNPGILPSNKFPDFFYQKKQTKEINRVQAQ
jgi:hypothetical protein